MIALTTPVALPTSGLRLGLGNRIVSLGSCFADEVASRMAASGFEVLQNPFGTLFNPLSIAQALDALLSAYRLSEADLVQHEGLYHSWLHHGRFSRPSAEECLEACHAAMAQAAEALRHADLLVITFGTAWVYRLASDGRLVANCHKLAAEAFERSRLAVDDIVRPWLSLIPRLVAYNPSLQLLFTVSPVRHKADGLHANQLSKATLLLATEALVGSDPQRLHYFPAYELLLDELRDYRFYASDLVHPSDLAADLVWERFQEAYLTPADRQEAHNRHKRSLRSRHIPLH